MRSTRRGPSSRAWARIRRGALNRAGWICRRCQKRGRMEVHHRDGDSSNNEPANLEVFSAGGAISGSTGGVRVRVQASRPGTGW